MPHGPPPSVQRFGVELRAAKPPGGSNGWLDALRRGHEPSRLARGWRIEVQRYVQAEGGYSAEQRSGQREPALSVTRGEAEKELRRHPRSGNEVAQRFSAVLEASDELRQLVAEGQVVHLRIAIDPHVGLVDRVPRVSSNVLTDAARHVRLQP